MDDDTERSRNATLDTIRIARAARDDLLAEVAGRLAAHDLEIGSITAGRTRSGCLVLRARFGRRDHPLRLCSIEFETQGPLSSLSSATIAEAFRNLGPLSTPP